VLPKSISRSSRREEALIRLLHQCDTPKNLRNSEPPHVGSHEKRGQDKIVPERKPKVILTFDLAGQPSEQVLRASAITLFWTAASARFADSLDQCNSVNALRHTWGTRFCGPWSLGSWRAWGPSSYGNFGLRQFTPNVWVSPGLPDPLLAAAF
jgi:hypothetical protein